MVYSWPTSLFPVYVLLLGTIVYWISERKGPEFFLAFLLLLPLWEPRSTMFFVSLRRPFELRWSDVFVVILAVRMLWNWKLRWPWERRFTILVSFFAFGILVLIARLLITQDTNTLMYLLVYVRLIGHLAVIGLYVRTYVNAFDRALFLRYIGVVSIVVLGVILIGNIYQAVSLDFDFRDSIGAMVGRHNWDQVRGGSAKIELRPNMLFDHEPYATGMSVVLLSAAAWYSLGWSKIVALCIGLVAVLLSGSNSGIMAFLVFALFVVPFVHPVATKLKTRITRIAISGYSILAFATVSLMLSEQARLLALRIAAVFLTLTSRFFSNFGEIGRRVARVSIRSFEARTSIFADRMVAVEEGLASYLFGAFSYSTFDNHFLFVVAVFGYIGLIVFVVSHYGFGYLALRDLTSMKPASYRLTVLMLTVFFLALLVMGLTGEPLRHIRTMHFLYPLALVWALLFYATQDVIDGAAHE